MNLFDPAQRESGHFSIRANIGDVCLAVAPNGYWIGSVTAVDAGGMATRMAVGEVMHDVGQYRKGIEPRGHFGPQVHTAFGWCATASEAESRLRPHLIGGAK